MSFTPSLEQRAVIEYPLRPLRVIAKVVWSNYPRLIFQTRLNKLPKRQSHY